jgi:hypothetical protein
MSLSLHKCSLPLAGTNPFQKDCCDQIARHTDTNRLPLDHMAINQLVRLRKNEARHNMRLPKPWASPNHESATSNVPTSPASRSTPFAPRSTYGSSRPHPQQTVPATSSPRGLEICCSRHHGSIDDLTTIEAEELHYAAQNRLVPTGKRHEPEPPEAPGRSNLVA